jgi:CheY-like chemotaxis protein
VPISNEQGDIVEWFGAARNITGRKRAEEAFREADRRKDVFLATLAHELRNPLAPLHNGVQRLRRTSMGNACDRDCAVIDMMERQVSQLIRLVDELLEVSRISRGKIELRKEQSDMAAILRNALETSQPLIEKNGHEATLGVPPDALPVHGDPMRLAQVFTNLINNAAKYTPPGGRITVDASRQGQEAVVEVRDNGFGISAEDLPRVFDLFGQALSGQEGGLGIGLALARNLVEMHGGKIDARSDGPGNGSVFIVRLPLDHSLPLECPKNVGPPAPTDYARRVLVIDDDHDVANSLGMLLESLGAKVRVVYDGQSGVEILPAFDPDIVFIDIGMPKVDGYETARRIRSNHHERRFSLVALTGWGQNEDRRRAQDAGFDLHLTKPAPIDALENLLARVRSAGGAA